MSDTKRAITERMLEWAGYQKLRPGRIHVYCMKCGRRYSNAPRNDYDHPHAELVQTWCLKCSQGCKDLEETYLDGDGKRIGWDEMEAHIRAREAFLRGQGPKP